MSNQIQKVNLIGINKEGIKEDSNFRGHIFFPFKLSTYPDPRWVDIFRYKYGIYVHSKKRLFLEQRDDELVFDIRDDDDNPQTFYDILKEVVEATNRTVDRKNVRIVAEEKEREEKNREIREKINRLKEKADKIKM